MLGGRATPASEPAKTLAPEQGVALFGCRPIAGELTEKTIGAVRAAGGRKLVWHTGEGISPPFMGGCLARCGFETTEELDVLAYFLGSGLESRPADQTPRQFSRHSALVGLLPEPGQGRTAGD